jgi:hypothetical protein
MIKTKVIDTILILFRHRQKIVKARKPSRMPSNGFKITKQNETSQLESLVVGFLFTLFSQAFGARYFTKDEIPVTG